MTIETDPRVLLGDHHRATERACTALLARTYADDPQELIAQYRVFEHALLDHITAEEELILPAYEEHAPEDASAIRQEHAAIRQALYRLGIDVELHVVRAHSVNDLVAALRAHAAREDRQMYTWAQQYLPPVKREQLGLRVRRSLHALTQFRHHRSTAQVEHR